MRITHPIYGSLEFDELQTLLINTPEMQRLRWISQLGLVSLAFPGGDHNRLLHSLGVCHIAGEIAEHLKIDSYEKRLIQTAALLHDIGQAPFSHSLEKLIPIFDKKRKNHEEIAYDIILGKKIMDIPGAGTIPSILKKMNFGEGEIGNIARLVAGRYTNKRYLQQTINSAIDADKLDYLVIESERTGTQHGKIDRARVIDGMKIEKTENGMELVFEDKVQPAIAQVRTARTNMLADIYVHHTSRIAERMLLKACILNIKKMKKCHEWIDSQIISALLSSKGKSCELIQRIIFNYDGRDFAISRNLYKAAYQIDSRRLSNKNKELIKILKKKGALRIERELCRIFNLEDGELLVDFPGTESPYGHMDFEKEGIRFVKREGKTTNYSMFSVYCDKKYKERVREAVKRYLSRV